MYMAAMFIRPSHNSYENMVRLINTVGSEWSDAHKQTASARAAFNVRSHGNKLSTEE